MNKEAFRKGFLTYLESNNVSKAEAGEFLCKEAQQGWLEPIIQTAFGVPGYMLGAGALTGGGLWLLMQKAKEDAAKRKQYGEKVKDLDRMLMELESSGVIGPAVSKPEEPATLWSKLKKVPSKISIY